jgi:uncharacterized protein YqgV (UPF0045/DUF77 family)
MPLHLSAQLSVYPLRGEKLSPAINQTIGVIRRHNVRVQPGTMSTLVTGEADAVFSGLQEAFQSVASGGDVVMTVTLSNACPAAESDGA